MFLSESNVCFRRESGGEVGEEVREERREQEGWWGIFIINCVLTCLEIILVRFKGTLI